MLSKSVVLLWIYCNFSNFQNDRCHHLGFFEIEKFYWQIWAVGSRRMPNFVQICQSVAETLRFFDFSRWRPPPSWIFEIAKFYWLFGWWGLRCISTQNFVKIGQSVTKILWYSIFQDGGRRHLGLSNSQNFIGCRCLEGPCISLYQISSKSVVPFQRYCDLSNFKIGRRRHLGFLKSRNFTGYWGPKGRDASACQILSKLVVPLRRYCDFSNFQDSPRRHLVFLKSRNFTGYWNP